MTNTEIKKAWEVMKKEIKKELGLDYGFTMNAKQINNRTATYLVCNTRSYEDEIRLEQESIEKVMGYSTWTEAEKARRKENGEKQIARHTALLEKFGTKENELRMTHEAILNSKAFKKFASNFESVTTEFEIKENFYYYIRFNY